MPAITRMLVLALCIAVAVVNIWQRHHLSPDVLDALGLLALLAAIGLQRTLHAATLAAIAYGVVASSIAVDRLPGHLSSLMNPVPARIEGVVEYAKAPNGRSAAIEVMGSIDLQSAPPSRPLRIRISIVGLDSTKPLPAQGECVVVFGTARLPEPNDLPGAFSERGFAQTRGVAWLVTAKHTMVSVLHEAGYLNRWLEGRRKWLKEHVERLYPPDVAPIVIGLLSGEKADIAVTDRNAFVRAGTAHLLSVSGLHVGLIAGICMVLFTWCGTILRCGLVVLCVGVFVMFTGANPPAVRAGVVVLVAMMGYVAERNTEPLRLLTVAVWFMWLLDPTVLYSASLHLSVGACLGLMIIPARIQTLLKPTVEKRNAMVRWLSKSFAVSLGASVGVMIPAAIHLGSLSFYSCLTNMVVVPVLSAAMMLAVAASVLEPLIGFAAESIAIVVSVCVRLGVRVTHFMAQAEPSLPSDVVPVVIVMTIGLYWVACSPKLRHGTMRLLIAAVLTWQCALIPATSRKPVETWFRYGLTVTIRRWPGLTWVQAIGPNDYRPDATLATSLASEQGMLIFEEYGAAASRIADAIERRRRVIRTAYLADRWRAKISNSSPLNGFTR
jgi:ComEC/Rec2-related protein